MPHRHHPYILLAFAAAFAAAALRPLPPRASVVGRGRAAAASMAEQPTPGKKQRRRGLQLWGRIRERFREAEEMAEDDGDADVAQLLEGVSKDIDTALSTRRRRLNAKLGTSLKRFREDVLDEVELQADEARERQARLRSRQQSIQDSLKALRQDLLDEIEDGLAGVQRGGRTLERALRDMRTTWEDEVNELVEEAKADVDLAVADLEEAIDKQKDEWNTAISSFDGWWGSQVCVGGSMYSAHTYSTRCECTPAARRASSSHTPPPPLSLCFRGGACAARACVALLACVGMYRDHARDLTLPPPSTRHLLSRTSLHSKSSRLIGMMPAAHTHTHTHTHTQLSLTHTHTYIHIHNARRTTRVH